MELMKRILIPTDFSAVANNAVLYALALTKDTNAKYVFFHAGKEDALKLKENIRNVSPIVDVLQKNVLYEAADIDFKGDEINNIVKKYGIDLLIMGTHGEKTPISPNIFGSNTSALIERLNIPVIAVPPTYTYRGISKVAYAADLINLKKELSKVIAFAKTVKASIDIIHVTPVFPDLGDIEKIDVNNLIDEVKKKNNFDEISYYIEKTKNDNQIAKGIEDYIKDHSPDLLAIFHISRSWIDKIVIPSATVKEVTRIKIPILIFPKEL